MFYLGHSSRGISELHKHNSRQGRRNGEQEGQMLLLPFMLGERGSKTALFEMQWNSFQTLIGYNGGPISFKNKEHMAPAKG